MPRTKEQKYRVEIYFSRKLASKDNCAHANSIKQTMSKFRHSQKRLLKTINCSASNAGKLASENNFSPQKHMEKDLSTPTQLIF